MPHEIILNRLRHFLLTVALLMFGGTLVELWLLDHTKVAVQIIPFVLCGIGLTIVAVALFRPSRPVLLVLRAAMVFEGLGSLLGIGYHLFSNFSFEHEIRPNVPLEALALPTLKGAAPIVAPGMLLFAALLAIAATYYHPALPAARQSS